MVAQTQIIINIAATIVIRFGCIFHRFFFFVFAINFALEYSEKIETKKKFAWQCTDETRRDDANVLLGTKHRRTYAGVYRFSFIHSPSMRCVTGNRSCTSVSGEHKHWRRHWFADGTLRAYYYTLFNKYYTYIQSLPEMICIPVCGCNFTVCASQLSKANDLRRRKRHRSRSKQWWRFCLIIILILVFSVVCVDGFWWSFEQGESTTGQTEGQKKEKSGIVDFVANIGCPVSEDDSILRCLWMIRSEIHKSFVILI